MSESGDRIGERALEFDMENPAHLEAFYSGFGASFYEQWRKIVLSNCEEMIRAKYELAKTKISEDRIDCLAHLHDSYLDYVITHWEGRKLREENVRSSLVAS